MYSMLGKDLAAGLFVFYVFGFGFGFFHAFVDTKEKLKYGCFLL